MKRFLSTFLLIWSLIFSTAFAAGKIQNEDIKSLTDLTTAGGTKAQLINDTKIYVTANGLNDQLSTLIAGGSIGGGGGAGGLLTNSDFELPSIGSAWVTTGATSAINTTLTNVYSGKQSLSITPTSTSSTFSVSQVVTTNGGLVGTSGTISIALKVPSAHTNVLLCPAIDGVEITANCIAALNNNLFNKPYTIPIIFGSTSASIIVRSNGNATSTTALYADYGGMNLGLSIGSLGGDVVLSATISSGTTVSQSSNRGSNWLSGCTNSSTSTCNFAAGTFTVAPTCVVTTDNTLTNVQGANISGNITTSSIVVAQVAMASGSAVNGRFYLTCTKQGIDYQSASSSAYVASNTNISALYVGPPTGTVSSTPSIMILGTKSNDTANAYNTSTGVYTVPATGSYDISAQTDLAITPIANGKTELYIYVNGVSKFMAQSRDPSGSTESIVPINIKSVPLTAGQTVTILVSTSNTSPSYVSSATTNYFSISKSDSPYVVGSFAGFASSPGTLSGFDNMAVSFGTTNLSTQCSASPCFIDQIGNGITSITRASTGVYSVNFVRTYKQAKCVYSGNNGGASTVGPSGPLSCTNCSNLQFTLLLSGANTVSDAIGTLICQGTY